MLQKGYMSPDETLEWLRKHITPEVMERAKIYGERLRIAAERRRHAPPTFQDHYGGCRRLSDELELETFFHITPSATTSYFTIERNKPRSAAIDAYYLHFGKPYEVAANIMLHNMIPIHRKIELGIVDKPNTPVELVDGVWQLKGKAEFERVLEHHRNDPLLYGDRQPGEPPPVS